MKFSENIHYRPRIRLFNFGFVPDSGGTFTFDLLKITWFVYLYILYYKNYLLGEGLCSVLF